MSQIAVALVAGVLFGLGLIVSRMVDPSVVLGFLDVAGDWNPTLALVLLGAVVTTAIGYRLSWSRRTPLAAERFSLPSTTSLDAKLVSGAVVFGLGWGLIGLCPGPALTGLALGVWQVYVFVAAMLLGMVISRAATRRGKNHEKVTESPA